MSSVMARFTHWFEGSSALTQLSTIDFGIQWTLWGVACLLKTDKFYDLAGSSTFILLASLNYKWHPTSNLRPFIQTGCVIVWAARLGSYLFTRILRDGRDRRFKEALQKPALLWMFWTMQGLWVIGTLLPSLVTVMAPTQQPIGWRDYIGWGIWASGFCIESLADYQKKKFRTNPTNEGKFISRGLWSLSRHPNYLGEIMLWYGLYVSASSNFTGYQYLLALCPLMDYLLITRVSGVPALERYGQKKWGRSPQYQEYIKKTPVLVPFLNP